MDVIIVVDVWLAADITQKIYESQKAFYIPGFILSAVAGYLIGYPLGQAIFNPEDTPWFMAGIGAGVFVISLPFSIVSSKKLQLTVESYNRNLNMIQ